MQFLYRKFIIWFIALLSVVVSFSAIADTNLSHFTFSGTTRFRYENLNDQFRKNLTGSDKVLAIRNLLAGSWRGKNLGFTAELQDSRAYMDDRGTPLSKSVINTSELLQSYGSVFWNNTSSAWIEDSQLKFGRFTLDIGSRRFVERNGYRNTINAFQGFHWATNFGNNSSFDVFFTRPIKILPYDAANLDGNNYQYDRVSKTKEFWGAHLRNFNILGDIFLDLFTYGYKEKDTRSVATLDRDVYAPGFRLLKPKRPGMFDFELETAFRQGSQSKSLSKVAKKVRVRSHMIHFEAGFSFHSKWAHRLNVEFDLATGDDSESDTIERYDRFYGTRRGDLGNTSIHGPLTRSNVVVPGFRWSFDNGFTDGRIVLQKPNLESGTDRWFIAGYFDPKGMSGVDIGTTLDFRIRHWLDPNRIRVELGGSVFHYGEFPKKFREPGESSQSIYIYSQIVFYF